MVQPPDLLAEAVVDAARAAPTGASTDASAPRPSAAVAVFFVYRAMGRAAFCIVALRR